MKNGVIYARYSSDAQREESIEGQIRDCKAYAERNGINLIGEYIDRAISAKTDNRPDFQRMLQDAANGEFNVVLVWKYDRFSRNRADSTRYKTLFKLHGVDIISINEAISDGAEGIILEAMLEAMAEYYIVDLSKKVQRGMTDNVINGKANGGSVTFGYKVDPVTRKYLIDEPKAECVRKIYDMFLSGILISNIVSYLEKHGLKNARDNNFNYNGVERILKNKRYTGEYVFRETVNPNGFPQIISKEKFEQVQEIFRTKKRDFSKKNSAYVSYPLTGILLCSQCGKQMLGETGTSHTGRVYRYYKCYTAKMNLGCYAKAIRKSEIENAVLESIMNHLCEVYKTQLVQNLQDIEQKKADDLNVLKEEIHKTKWKISNLLNFIADGNVEDVKSISDKLNKLERKKESLESQLKNEQQGLDNFPINETVVVDWLKNEHMNLTDEIKTMLMRILVERIYV